MLRAKKRAAHPGTRSKSFFRSCRAREEERRALPPPHADHKRSRDDDEEARQATAKDAARARSIALDRDQLEIKVAQIALDRE